MSDNESDSNSTVVLTDSEEDNDGPILEIVHIAHNVAVPANNLFNVEHNVANINNDVQIQLLLPVPCALDQEDNVAVRALIYAVNMKLIGTYNNGVPPQVCVGARRGLHRRYCSWNIFFLPVDATNGLHPARESLRPFTAWARRTLKLPNMDFKTAAKVEDHFCEAIGQDASVISIRGVLDACRHYPNGWGMRFGQVPPIFCMAPQTVVDLGQQLNLLFGLLPVFPH